MALDFLSGAGLSTRLSRHRFQPEGPDLLLGLLSPFGLALAVLGLGFAAVGLGFAALALTIHRC